MRKIANLLFQARMLKVIPRSGYGFLGAGAESIAEHSFLTTFIAYVISELSPEADSSKLVAMSLVHDLPESLTGDMNYVQKKYVASDEAKAIRDTVQGLPFEYSLSELLEEFSAGESLEARLARDADQLSLAVELKSLLDTGYAPPEKWLLHIKNRIKTEIGMKIFEMIMETDKDTWWLDNYVEPKV